jgi:hypothetical protein
VVTVLIFQGILTGPVLKICIIKRNRQWIKSKTLHLHQKLSEVVYDSGFQIGFRGTLGFLEGVLGVSRIIYENLGGLYVPVIIITDFL